MWDVLGVGLDYSDVHPSYFTIQPLNLELRKECCRMLGRPGLKWLRLHADTFVER